MIDFTIGNECTLPSLGKVYKKQINPQVKLRSMTTAEEMKRLNHSDRAYKPMAEVIDDCIVDNLGISAYDLCTADYQFLLHRLRIVTYGTNYKISSKCPYCLTEHQSTINLSEDLKCTQYDEAIYKKYSEFVLPACNKTIKLRMQSPRILDEVSIKAKDTRKRFPQMVGDPAFLITLSSLIETIDGKEYEEFMLDEFVRKLQMVDANYILKSAQKLNNSFGLDTTINNTCSFCGLDYGSSFRITSEFFGPSIDE